MTNEPLDRVTDLELLRRDIHRQGDVLHEVAGPLRAAAQEVVAAIGGDLPRIYLVGCGDSLDAGMATRLTWERLTGLAVEAVPAMSFSYGLVDTAPAGSLVVALSQSGTVRRVVESVRVARTRGLRTLVITGNADSPLALEPSDGTMILDFPKLGFVPGTTSYAVALMGHLELAAAFGRDAAEIAALRAEIERAGDHVGAAQDVVRAAAEEHSHAFTRSTPILVLGSGAQSATARFAARKFFEIPQLITISQETEEYAHDEFSIIDERFRVILLAPPDRGLARSAEIARGLRGLGVHLAVVTEGRQSEAFTEIADVIYAMPAVPTDLAPLTYALPSQSLAYFLADRLGGSYYNSGDKTHAGILDVQIYEGGIYPDP
ncbi:MAG: SIS domain-containing protein [Candidatus Limnocylindrales bacterium]